MLTREEKSLAEMVCDRIDTALAGAADREAETINVHMKGSCAVLLGTVRSWAERRDAEEAARATPGVTSVDNQLALLVKARPSTPHVLR
jgi:osmotically-inducible protein OsmY